MFVNIADFDRKHIRHYTEEVYITATEVKTAASHRKYTLMNTL